MQLLSSHITYRITSASWRAYDSGGGYSAIRGLKSGTLRRLPVSDIAVAKMRVSDADTVRRLRDAWKNDTQVEMRLRLSGESTDRLMSHGLCVVRPGGDLSELEFRASARGIGFDMTD